MTEKTTTKFSFEPPGPGFRGLDAVRLPRPVTLYWTEAHPEPFLRGTLEFSRNYGILIDGLDMA